MGRIFYLRSFHWKNPERLKNSTSQNRFLSREDGGVLFGRWRPGTGTRSARWAQAVCSAVQLIRGRSLALF